ncbi:sn-glycerol-3-phosphate ABC transporter ATP-binding protein UgpC [Planomicrobium sp. Y74]|uniref:ABC transporter ATP-binding protein n=1 Tax=Planomicrobium sp. Y74 TaxID=2478977 RepID=UPI000EF4E6BF|nr:sn-glycerol-3-phosphate ABC transporter ATP-binding protein UgpC [Planomicrobium sp. Y74]RLQ91570.1 sn-glycerol-3-phosphate ABC transporter ATP-binding protein UgpC [Planomicrobium sp. Y74]
MAKLLMEQLTKTYDNKAKAVENFNLTVEDEEFIVFVGPSGCGKSTTLRMIAGLEDISSGTFSIDGKKMNEVEPKDRDIAMVFQNYALYPHMTVYENMAFSLKLKKMPKAEIKERVRNAAEILGLMDYLNRKPKALSGGQRQRVALGRAIVRDAKLFLMDEPLSNLDSKLRVQMRTEISKLHQRLKTTTIYVTHDQTEAMTMATRIVIMKDGVIQQVGTPKEVYDQPDNVFVAGFIGSPAMNFFNGRIEGNYFVMGQTKLLIPDSALPNGLDNLEVIIGLRPEHITHKPDKDQSTVEVNLDVVELMGSEYMVYATLEGRSFVGRVDANLNLSAGTVFAMAFEMDKARFFDPTTEKRIK